MTKPAILVRLKHATAHEHRALEDALDLLNPALTRDSYTRLLQRFYGFYAPYEAALLALDGWDAYGFDMRARQKTPWLIQDLVLGGMNPAAIAALPRCAAASSLVQTMSDAAGCLYVLEGATLGGQLIARHMRQQFGVTPEHGCSFFASYNAHVGSMWRAYGQFAAAVAERQPDDAALLAAARATFTHLRRWLGRYHHDNTADDRAC